MDKKGKKTATSHPLVGMDTGDTELFGQELGIKKSYFAVVWVCKHQSTIVYYV